MRSRTCSHATAAVLLVAPLPQPCWQPVRLPRLRTPASRRTPRKEAVRSYFDASTRCDVPALEALLDPDDSSNRQLIQAFEAVCDLGIVVESTNVSVHVVENDGHTARLTSAADVTVKANGDIAYEGKSGDVFTAVNNRGRWLLVGVGEVFPPGWLVMD